jgi:AmmeMemoRadiSam system protein A
MMPAPAPPATLTDDHGGQLLRWARDSVRQALGGATAVRPSGGALEEPGAAFVTLRRGAELQGCIGNIVPRNALVDEVGTHAVSAALWDPRAAPIALDDVELLGVEVSVLSPLQRIEYDGEEESAIAALRPFVDGVVLRYGNMQGVFLPIVWRSLPEPRDFLAQLKRKASLPTHFWAPGVELKRFTVLKWTDSPDGLDA